MRTFKRLLAGVLAAAMTIGASSMLPVGAANVTFTDVSNHWAWTSGQIPYLVEKNVLNGYKQDNGTYIFKPDGNVKRAEFIKMLDEVFGLTETAPISYTDVSSKDWFYPYFQKAAAQGYILNYGTYVNPNGEITREEATALLVRYLDLPANEKADPSLFADYNQIADHFKEYVLRAIDAGIINGYKKNGQTVFQPKKVLTRAEALTILYRAAGCIFNETAYSRSGSAWEENNVVTRGNITISNVRFNGRNIVSEGADSGKITFTDCDINGTLYVRGGADITFDSCEVDDVIVLGGGDISLVSGTEIDSITLAASSDLGIYSGTKLSSLTVEHGADNVRVSGDGTLGRADIRARGFNSSVVPNEYEIGRNLTAIIGGQEVQGSSDEQNAFVLAPFSTADKTTRYINFVSDVDGRAYYYYTNLGDEPTASSFEGAYNRSDYAGSFEVRKGEALSVPTLSNEEVGKFSYVVVQLKDGSRRYAPALLRNHGELGTGFAKEPYLYDETTIKFQPAASSTLYWFYADNGDALSPIEFLSAYDKKESALKSTSAVNNIKTFSCSLKSKYLENYSYIAFMLKTGNDEYHQPVIVSAGDNGFAVLPTVQTPGIISYEANVAGDLYYYYSSTMNLPTPDKFKGEYNAAKYADNFSIRRNVKDTFKYDVEYIDKFPYLVAAIRNSDGEYMQPVLIDIDFSTGFRDAPVVKSGSEIRFRTEEAGTIRYYYTKNSEAPNINTFNREYNDQSSKYKDSFSVNDMFQTIEYRSSYASSYPFMAIMFIDEDGKAYSPVIVALDATLKTGFSIAPYAEDGVIYFRTEADGEVWYFYSKDASSVAAEDFEDYYDDESSSRRGTVSASAGKTRSITLDSKTLERYPYVVLAFTEDEGRHPDFSYPFVLDVAQSEMSAAGTGLEVGEPHDGEVRIKALYEGRLYWYRTNSEKDFPSGNGNFEAKYDAARDSDRIIVEEGDREYLEFGDYDYIVAALRVNGEFLNYVTIHCEKGAASDDDGIPHDKDDTGLRVSGITTNSITVEFYKYDGTVRLYILSDGKLVELDSAKGRDGDEVTLELPPWIGSNEILDILSGPTYVQLTDSDGKTHKALEVRIIK